MQSLNKNYVVFGLFTLLLGLLPTVKGGEDGLQASQQVIESVSTQIQQKLKDKTFAQNFAQVTEFISGVISPHTDFDKIAPLVLGKHWKTATTEEQQHFKHEFQTLIVRTYSRAFIEYNDWTIRFMPVERSNEATKVIVKTEVLQPGLQAVDVNYRMFQSNGDQSNGEWKVYDILINGVSLVTNYRSTFNDEINTKGSLSAVIDGLVKRNAEALSARDF